jgi:chorismate mutase
MDLDMNGLIIETHPDPENAWSDASQQITPEKLIQIINSLSLKREYSEDKNYTGQLLDLRDQIDRLDNELIHTLKLRKNIVEKIAVAKLSQNITALQRSRLDQLMKDRVESGIKLGLDENYIKEIFSTIHNQSIENQTDIFNKKSK